MFIYFDYSKHKYTETPSVVFRFAVISQLFHKDRG